MSEVTDEAVERALEVYLAVNSQGAEREVAMRAALEAAVPLLGTRPQPGLLEEHRCTDLAEHEPHTWAYESSAFVCDGGGTRPQPTLADHEVRVEFDGRSEAVDLTFICNAAPDADCHMVCPRECESCNHPRTEQVPYCNPSEFINNGDSVIQTAERQPYLTLPVSLSWNGDTYVWTVIGAAVRPLPTREQIEQTLERLVTVRVESLKSAESGERLTDKQITERVAAAALLRGESGGKE